MRWLIPYEVVITYGMAWEARECLNKGSYEDVGQPTRNKEGVFGSGAITT